MMFSLSLAHCIKRIQPVTHITYKIRVNRLSDIGKASGQQSAIGS